MRAVLTALFCGLISLVPVNAGAEWTDDDSVLAKAEQAMADYLLAGFEPKRWAVLGRGEYFGMSFDKGIRREEVFFNLIARSRGDRDRTYFSHGEVWSKSNDTVKLIPANHASGIWHEALRVDEDRYHKRGHVLHPEYFKVNKSGLIEGTKQPWVSVYHPFDPFQLPISIYASYRTGTVNRSETERVYLDKSMLKLADFDANQGVLKGVWFLPGVNGRGGILIVTFSEAEGWRPVLTSAISWKQGEDVRELLTNGKAHSLTSTKWKLFVNVDGVEKVYAPVVFRIVYQDDQLSILDEREIRFDWVFGEKVDEAFPAPDDLDWREPMRKLFDEDFTQLSKPDIVAKP